MIQYLFESIWLVFYSIMWRQYGWLCGSVLNLVVTQLFKYVMHQVFNYEPLNQVDRVFAYEDPQDFLQNMVGCCFFDKFEYEIMKNHLLKKTETINRLRHLKVKFFGINFFKLMNKQEWDLAEKSYVVIKEGISNQD